MTFDLVTSGAGTVLTLTEVGFREQGWDHYQPRLVDHVDQVVSVR